MRAVFSLPVSLPGAVGTESRDAGERTQFRRKDAVRKTDKKGEENYGKTFIYFRICNRGTSGQNV